MTTSDAALREYDPGKAEAARRHIRAARYDDALELLQGCEDWPSPHNEEAVLLCADVWTRRDPVAALELLARSQDLFETPGGLFGYYLATGKAYANSRNYDAAAAMFLCAARLVNEGDPSWQSLLAYQKSRLAWLTRDFDPQSEDIQIALQDPTPNAQLLGLSMRAWMHAGLENYEEQISDLSKALLVAQANPDMCDTASTALAIYSLLNVAYELGDSVAVQIGENAFETLEWTPDIQVERFQSLRRLAWDAFLHGKSARAQWLLKDSKDHAPTPAWKVMAHVDRAYVARMNLNEIWATEELLQAHKLARDVQWSSTCGEERMALVYLAILFAPSDMAQAQRYVSAYIAMGTENVNPTLAITNDRRAIAIEKYASGRVHQVLGHKELATTQLAAAYDIYSQTRHHYRAAQAASALAEITQSMEWHEKALSHASHFPQSPMYERLNDTEGPVKDAYGLEDLTAMQRQIAHALAEGLDMAELSRRFSRSTFTLGKQIEIIYQTLGVSNRSELRAELQNRAG